MSHTDYKLGRGNGTIREFPDGTAEYRRNLSAQFRVRIAEVKGFSRTKGPIWSDGELHVLGHGTTLATVGACSLSASKEIEQWFRDHPLFDSEGSTRGNPSAKPSQSLIADELRKLADLQRDGVISKAEFDAQKRKLLSS